jgi:hypothetical protein
MKETITIPPAISTDQELETFLQGWSWGGFFLNWIYFFASRAYVMGVLYFVGSLIPIVDIVIALVAGMKGRKISFERGKWNDAQAFIKRQKLLDRIGIIVTIVTVVAILVLGLVIVFRISKQLEGLS